jgi:hypothetical protein
MTDDAILVQAPCRLLDRRMGQKRLRPAAHSALDWPQAPYPLTHQIMRETAPAPRLMVQQALGGKWAHPLT